MTLDSIRNSCDVFLCCYKNKCYIFPPFSSHISNLCPSVPSRLIRRPVNRSSHTGGAPITEQYKTQKYATVNMQNKYINTQIHKNMHKSTGLSIVNHTAVQNRAIHNSAIYSKYYTGRENTEFYTV